MREPVYKVYKVMMEILRLRDVKVLLAVHLVAKIGFVANDAVTALKLRQKGMSQEDIALMMLIDFPLEVGLGYYAGKWSQSMTPMKVWSRAFVGRLVAAVLAQIVVTTFPQQGVNTPYLIATIFQHLFSTAMSTIMFVAVSAFHTQIADRDYGGTYMTLLATFSNLGGTFPRFFILKSIDVFTTATCRLPSDGTSSTIEKFEFDGTSCVLEQSRRGCEERGGICETIRDGYDRVNLFCVILGALVFWQWIRPTVETLQRRPLSRWRPTSVL